MDQENQIVKMSILLKLMKRFNVIPFTILASYFAGMVKHFNVYMESKKIYTGQHHTEENRTKLEDSHYPISRLTIKGQQSRQCSIDKK